MIIIAFIFLLRVLSVFTPSSRDMRRGWAIPAIQVLIHVWVVGQLHYRVVAEGKRFCQSLRLTLALTPIQ